MPRLVLLRHGQSTWNQENRFTGWTDVDLSALGEEEARRAGRLMKAAGILPDVAFTSVLKRAIRTLSIALEELDRLWIPVLRSWRLNERHYGALQGLDKMQTVEKHGAEQVALWRRSYDVPPPPLDPTDPRHPAHDLRYRDMPPRDLPRTESLKDTVARFLPYWQDAIVPALRAGKEVLVAAHGNSLRALVKHLDRVGDEAIVKLNVPTGFPLVYELDGALEPLRSAYLGDQDEIERATRSVAEQTKK